MGNMMVESISFCAEFLYKFTYFKNLPISEHETLFHIFCELKFKVIM